MSEFSESYQLRTTKAEDAVGLLRRAGRSGFVFQARGGWVTFFVPDGESQADERVVAANVGTLLYFVACEDHGWGFSLFEGAKRVSGYEIDWTRKLRIEDAGYVGARLQPLVAAGRALGELEAVLRPASGQAGMESGPMYVFVKLVGLGEEAWLTYDVVAEETGEFPGVIEV